MLEEELVHPRRGRKHDKRVIMERAKPLLDSTREVAVAFDVDGMQRGF